MHFNGCSFKNLLHLHASLRNSQLGKQVGGMRYIRLLSILSVACAAVGLVYSLKLSFSKEQSFRVKRWVFADAEDHVQLSSDGGIIDGGLVHVSSDELTFEPAGEREREQRGHTCLQVATMLADCA